MSIQQIFKDITDIKESQRDSIERIQDAVDAEFKRKQRNEIQPEDLMGLHIAIVVDTVDPLKQGRVRYYTPYLNDRTTDPEGLPWASPISPFGGFDDSGCIWVPPAGSKIAILFADGNVNSAYYLGSVWYRHRGADGQHLPFWDNVPIQEYSCYWDGRRNGYLVGDNTGDQVLPPWNTEMYNGYDIDSVTDFYKEPEQFNSITSPYIKGFKTEGKHYLKLVDGDPKCNRRWTRMEMSSGRGNFIMFKDDHLHPAGQWAFGDFPGAAFCHEDYPDDNIPLEHVCCSGDVKTNQPCLPTQCFPKQCPDKDFSNSNIDLDKFRNPYYKRQEEMRPYEGANTPMENKCELDQSGIHMQSISGHQLVMDDAVNHPTGVPTWDRDFDFGCDDTFAGRMYMRSATGHFFELNDQEDLSNVRGEENGIQMRTATGNFFEMNDHTLSDGLCGQEIAGERRGITMSTTSSHLFQMNDAGLKQASEIRKDGGIPSKAEQSGFSGYCLLRSGYGLQILMKDADRQDETVNQFIQVMAPQKDNLERGPHMMIMQEQPTGPGYVFLRAGGVYYQASYDDSIEVVGDEDSNPSSKFLTVTDSLLVDVKNTYFNRNDLSIFLSKSYIYLLAGEDCEEPDQQTLSTSQSQQSQSISAAQQSPGSSAGKSKKGPCIYNPIVSKDPWVCPITQYVHYGILADDNGPVLDSRSERVFMSAEEPGA